MNETDDIANKIVIELMEYSSMDFNDEELYQHNRRVTLVKDAMIANRQSAFKEAAGLSPVGKLPSGMVEGSPEAYHWANGYVAGTSVFYHDILAHAEKELKPPTTT